MDLLTDIYQRIRTWIDDRRRARAYRFFKEGFGWALAEYYIDGVSLENLQMIVESGRSDFLDGPDQIAFDNGIEEAVAKLEALVDAPRQP